jgi:hypothetical protein
MRAAVFKPAIRSPPAGTGHVPKFETKTPRNALVIVPPGNAGWTKDPGTIQALKLAIASFGISAQQRPDTSDETRPGNVPDKEMNDGEWT